MKGKQQTKFCIEFNRKRLLNGESKRLNLLPRDPEKMKIKSEKSRKRMINGGAKYMHSFPVMGFKNNEEWMKNTKGKYLRSFIKKTSKDELTLRNLVKSLYPNCIFQYTVINYDLDVALPEYKIAIEFDGYYHFDCQDNINYHNRRQSKIEKCGWRFIRYNIFKPFPTIEQIKQDIQ